MWDCGGSNAFKSLFRPIARPPLTCVTNLTYAYTDLPSLFSANFKISTQNDFSSSHIIIHISIFKKKINKRNYGLEIMRVERHVDFGFFLRSRQSTSSPDSAGRPRMRPIHHSLPTLVGTQKSQGHHPGQELGRCISQY